MRTTSAPHSRARASLPASMRTSRSPVTSSRGRRPGSAAGQARARGSTGRCRRWRAGPRRPARPPRPTPPVQAPARPGSRPCTARCAHRVVSGCPRRGRSGTAGRWSPRAGEEAAARADPPPRRPIPARAPVRLSPPQPPRPSSGRPAPPDRRVRRPASRRRPPSRPRDGRQLLGRPPGRAAVAAGVDGDDGPAGRGPATDRVGPRGAVVGEPVQQDERASATTPLWCSTTCRGWCDRAVTMSSIMAHPTIKELFDSGVLSGETAAHGR